MFMPEIGIRIGKSIPRHEQIAIVGVKEPPNISWGSASKGSKHLLTRYDWRILDV